VRLVRGVRRAGRVAETGAGESAESAFAFAGRKQKSEDRVRFSSPLPLSLNREPRGCETAPSFYSSTFPKGDQGGNSEMVKAGGRAIPLHSLWDAFIGTSTRYRVIAASATETSRNPRYKPEQFKEELARGKFTDWAEESFRQARAVAYLDGDLKSQKIPPPPRRGRVRGPRGKRRVRGPMSEQRTGFEAVRVSELERVKKRREEVHRVAAEGGRSPDPLERDLVGLAFSGGGIRSATFNLGVLQALGRLKLLTRIDYLSTVSGGGYIGGWLAAWIHRAAKRDGKEAVRMVQCHLNPRTNREEARPDEHHPEGREPEPATVRHLRAHSRYLAPRVGLFSLDAWTLLAIYVRNLFINGLLVAPAVLALVLLCRLVVLLFAWPRFESEAWLWVLVALFALVLLVAFLLMRWELARLD
jgi:hypothetical protein